MGKYLDDNTIQSLREKNLIFTITAGRTGTNLLQALFALLPDTLSLHEPEPDFVHAMRRTQQNPQIGLAYCITQKLPFIANNNHKNYIETTHLFCKGFVEAFLQCEVRPQLIFQKRHPREIALSLLKLGTIPSRTSGGLLYLLSPNDPNVLPLPQWEIMSDYQLCYWYCLEIEKRQRYYEEYFNRLGITTAASSINELTNYAFFCSLALKLGFKFNKDDKELQQKFTLVSTHKHNEKIKHSYQKDEDNLTKFEFDVLEKIYHYDPMLIDDINASYYEGK